MEIIIKFLAEVYMRAALNQVMWLAVYYGYYFAQTNAA